MKKRGINTFILLVGATKMDVIMTKRVNLMDGQFYRKIEININYLVWTKSNCKKVIISTTSSLAKVIKEIKNKQKSKIKIKIHNKDVKIKYMLLRKSSLQIIQI